MERASGVTLTHAKDHPVLRDAVAWQLTEVRYALPRRGDARVVLGVCRSGESLQLHFEGVDEFAVMPGFPDAPASGDRVGVRILDVTHLQWEGVTVRVESSCGGLSFWARSVRIAEGLSAPRRRARRP
ncbi:MAG: hypothetical protein NT171_05535 [Planctomycetota bacterium]|nr:hypothetical protein [Planctomycetota bacterium]